MTVHVLPSSSQAFGELFEVFEEILNTSPIVVQLKAPGLLEEQKQYCRSGFD